MKRYELPTDLRGEWIWSGSLLDKIDCYLFARKEFSLDISGVDAELWISAHSSYHLFINDRHVGFGPPPSSREKTYADLYDISYYLQPGTNVIAILARNLNVPVYSQYRKEAGIWCQLNINGTPTTWTDERWRIQGGTCYESNQPRRAFGMDFVENLDMNSFPRSWTKPNFNDRGWERPDYTLPLNMTEGEFIISKIAPGRCEEIGECTPVLRGRYEKSTASTHVSFADIFTGDTGVYAAQTYLYCETEKNLPVKIVSDDAFCFFCNNSLVRSFGIPEIHSGMAPERAEGMLYLQQIKGHCDKKNGHISFKKGWNRLLMVQQNGSNSMGFSISFPTIRRGSIKFMRHHDMDSILGWKIAGPLRLPLPEATGSLKLEHLQTSAYTPLNENVNDASSFLNDCRFEKIETISEEELSGKSGLKSGEYVIFDLGSIRYGFPMIDLEGSRGDIVDITFGTKLSKNRIPSFISSRNTDSVTLREGNNPWLKFEPTGMRYVMISARNTSDKVIIRNIDFTEFFKEFNAETAFECSDPVFNKIWEIGCETLRRTAVTSFLDSPCSEHSQYIADSFIQALACFYTYGDYSLSEKALREFASAQFENGYIPALSSGGIYSSIPDFALLWPVWLDHHIKASGSKGLREEMLSPLGMLLNFFKTLSKENGGLLVDLDKEYQMNCFIDFGDIDKRGMVTSLNAMYCRALLSSANIYDSAGLFTEAGACRTFAVDIAAKVRKLTMNQKTGLFADCYCDDKPSEKYSLQTNILALYSGIANPKEFDSIFYRFFNHKSPFEKLDDVHNNPYFKFFLLDTLFAFGKTQLALDYIKYYWGSMLECGASTWWNMFDPKIIKDQEPNTVKCQGYAVSPNIFMIRELAGIRPAEDGFLKVYFNPAVANVDWVKLILPTRKGRIRLEWKKSADGQLDVTVDANYPLDIAPMLPPEIKDKCTFTLSDTVNILGPQLEEEALISFL